MFVGSPVDCWLWSGAGLLCGRSRKYPGDSEQTAVALSVPHSPFYCQDGCVDASSNDASYVGFTSIRVEFNGFFLPQVVTLSARPLTSSLLSVWVWFICSTSALRGSPCSNLSPAGRLTLRGWCPFLNNVKQAESQSLRENSRGWAPWLLE